MGIFAKLLKQLQNKQLIGDLLDLRFYDLEAPLNDEDIQILCELLKQNEHIKKVNLHHQNIGDKGAQALASIATLEELDLSNGEGGYVDYANHISSEGALALASSQIKKINLSCNSIGDKGIEHFSSSSVLEELDVSSCSITDAGAAHFLKTNCSVTRLNLESNFLGEGHAMLALNANKHVQAINLTACEITSDGAVLIAGNTALKEVILTHNAIQDAGAQALAKNTTIEILSLMRCQIGDDGALAFASTRTLKVLHLSENSISSAVRRELFQRLPDLDLYLSDDRDRPKKKEDKPVIMEGPALLLGHKRSTEELLSSEEADLIHEQSCVKDGSSFLQGYPSKKHKQF